jgi:hypothetical protein
MKVLIACECSGLIRDAFIARGHEAMSCDFQATERPGPHYRGDVFDILNKEKWDLLIGHPPCTFIALSGSQWLSHPDDSHLPYDKRRPNPFYPNRREDQKKAIDFFQALLEADVFHIALENPRPMSALTDRVGNYSQEVQPYMFGDSYSKPTCLWLKNLPLLKNTNDDLSKKIHKGESVVFSSGKKQPKWYSESKSNDKSKTSVGRSRTFPGLAEAIADQWGSIEDYKDSKQLNVFDI